MTDRPIIFSKPMVLPLLREADEPGTGKSQTRRLLYTRRTAKNGVIPASATFLEGHRPPSPLSISIEEYWTLSGWHKTEAGDRLWVRETHFQWGLWDYQPDRDPKWKFFPDKTKDRWFMYEGDEAEGYKPPKRAPGKLAWYKRPAIFMPREASRLTLTMTGVRIERLNGISEQDCEREGVAYEPADPPFVYVPGIHPHSITAVGLEERSRHWPRSIEAACFSRLWNYINGPGAWEANPEVVVLTFSVALRNIDAEAA